MMTHTLNQQGPTFADTDAKMAKSLYIITECSCDWSVFYLCEWTGKVQLQQLQLFCRSALEVEVILNCQEAGCRRAGEEGTVLLIQYSTVRDIFFTP